MTCFGFDKGFLKADEPLCLQVILLRCQLSALVWFHKEKVWQ